MQNARATPPPQKLPPSGPPHVAGCLALCTAPPNAPLPRSWGGGAIIERTGVKYSRNRLYALLAALDLVPKSVTPHHASFDDLRRAVSLFTRTMRFSYNIHVSHCSDPPPDSMAA